VKILVTADLHLDNWDYAGRNILAKLRPQLEDVDHLFIAGDITNNPEVNWPDAMDRLAKLMDPSRIWVLPGNHDYYHFRLDGDDVLRRMAEDRGINWAQKRCVVLGNVRILCCTLWTDFNLLNDRFRSMEVARGILNDYRYIRKGKGGGPIMPSDTADLFDDHLAWLTAEMAKPFEGRTMIVTHHVPSPVLAVKVDAVTPCFISDLDPWIELHRPDAWLCGHTHYRLSGQVHGTPVWNVSIGYNQEVDIDREDEILERGLVDLGKPFCLPGK